MKYLLLPVIALLFACTNPKVKIVERQKVIGPEIQRLEVVSKMAEQHREKLFLAFDLVHTPAQKKTVDSLEDLKNKADKERWKLVAEYDSLEMELKKY